MELFGIELQLWGVPADPAHDEVRGGPVDVPERPLLTLPTSCDGPLETSYEALSWEDDVNSGSALTHDGGGSPLGLTGCGKLGFLPSIGVLPTIKEAQSPTGLDLSVDAFDEGLSNPSGIAQSALREVAFFLPEGVAAGPALTSSTGACSEADFAEEGLAAGPEEGCPDTAKIGAVEVETPLIEGATIEGTVYRAAPFANPLEDAPMALYVVVEDPDLGLLVKQSVGIEPDPDTEQLIAFAEDLPQLPFGHLRLHLDEDEGGPLINPPFCGKYETVAEFAPWAGDSPYVASAAFQIASGPNGGPCPVDEPEPEPEPEQKGSDPVTPQQNVAPVVVLATTGQAGPRRRHRCPKGKRKVHRHGKARCVRRRPRKA